MWKTLSISFLCLAYLNAMHTNSFAHQASAFRRGDYESDVKRLIALRSHPLNELLALANQLERKWSGSNWDRYAQLMSHVCSEIANRGLNDKRVREQSEHFARLALFHSRFYSWQYQSDLVGCLGSQRSSSKETVWLRERREKTALWLHTWQRLDQETDPTFDINDRSAQPSMRVYPPVETGLPAGTPPSAIKDLRLRAKYEAAIADNNHKATRVEQQLPLVSHGPAFKIQAERWLIQAYSQPPFRNAELKRMLDVYLHDNTIRQRIMREVEKDSK